VAVLAGAQLLGRSGKRASWCDGTTQCSALAAWRWRFVVLSCSARVAKLATQCSMVLIDACMLRSFACKGLFTCSLAVVSRMWCYRSRATPLTASQAVYDCCAAPCRCGSACSRLCSLTEHQSTIASCISNCHGSCHGRCGHILMGVTV
jgi:hypothetical protein